MEYSSVSKNCLKEWYILRSILLIVWSGIFVLIMMINTNTDNDVTAKIALLIVVGMIEVWLMIYLFIFPKKQYQRLRYRIMENRIEKQAGVIFLRTHYVPFVRVQHIEVYRGIFDRLFKMSTVLIFTAGTRVRIQNLNIDEAEEVVVKIRQLLGDVND